MAGPEDTTACSQHSSSAVDSAHERFFPPADHVNPRHLQPAEDSLKPHSTSWVSDPTPTDSTRPSDGSLRIDFRHKKSKVEPVSLTEVGTARKRVCQDDDTSDVFDVGSHGHLFFIEDDDAVTETTTYEEDYKDITGPGRSDWLCDDLEDSRSMDGTDSDGADSAFTEPIQDTRAEAETKEADKGTEDFSQDSDALNNNLRGDTTPRSLPVNIPPRPRPKPPLHRANTSPLMTVCRHSNSHLVYRCQVMVHTDFRGSSSCPAAFCPRWTQVVTPGNAAPYPGSQQQALGRKRCNTISCHTELAPNQVMQADQGLWPDCQDRDLIQDDPSQPGFKGRGRSYSDSDVQSLLMKEMSKELREMGDTFNSTRRRPLPTVCEEDRDYW